MPRKPKYFKRILRELLLSEPLSAFAIQKRFRDANRPQRGERIRVGEQYSQVHRELQKLSNLGYVKGTKSRGQKTEKIDYRLTDLGLTRALLEEKIDEHLISQVVKLYPESLPPIFPSWQAFVDHGREATFLSIIQFILQEPLRQDLLDEIEPVEREVRGKSQESSASELPNLPETVAIAFLIELGRGTHDPEIVSLLTKNPTLFKRFVDVHENLRLDQMLRANVIQEHEFRIFKRGSRADASRLYPRLTDELGRKLTEINRRELKRRYTQRFHSRLVLDMLDQYVLHV